jgi:hypothetical protein
MMSSTSKKAQAKRKHVNQKQEFRWKEDRIIMDKQELWTGFEESEDEVAGFLLWLAVFHDALRREPEEYAYQVIANTDECLCYAERRGITKEKVVQEINTITEHWLDHRFGVLRLWQRYVSSTDCRTEDERENPENVQ